MDLKHYFDQHEGVGVLATCDPASIVDVAMYCKPLVVDNNSVAFVMRQRLSHQNLEANLRAAYLFLEKGTEYKGIRLYLTMTREEINQTVVEQMRKKQPWICPAGDDSEKYLVFFTVDRVRSLYGDETL